MKHLKYLEDSKLKMLTNKRAGEVKIGECIGIVQDIKELNATSQKYVLLGIPEDIGVRTNFGRPGTRLMWENFLSVFLNMQDNRHNSASDVLILGEIDCSNELQDIETLDKAHKDYFTFLGNIVEQIDKKVEGVISQVFKAGKTPIIIGGGHNNAYGIIKGYYKAFGQPLNVLNIDAHTDLRNTDYRHSGNGFSFALEQQMIEKYLIFGVHKAYTPEYIYEFIAKNSHLESIYFEDILHLNPIEKLGKLKYASNFLNDYFGLEIDCDCIENFNSSAMTNSGFTINEMRNFLNVIKKSGVGYVHFCEGIPTKNKLTAKALSYFVGDFIRD